MIGLVHFEFVMLLYALYRKRLVDGIFDVPLSEIFRSADRRGIVC